MQRAYASATWPGTSERRATVPVGGQRLAFLSTARITRLVTWDAYPPVAWVRSKWDDRVQGDWNLLMHCGYCFGFWAALGVVGWGLIDLHLDGALEPAWWIINGVLAVSYLGAITMAYDGED